MIRLLSTGAVTRDPDHPDLEATLPVLAGLRVAGFELSIYSGWDLDEIAGVVEASPLRFVTAHAAKQIGAQIVPSPQTACHEFARNCELAARAGARLIVLHLWELPVGDAQLERNLRVLPRLLDAADAVGVTVAVETIPTQHATPLDNVRSAVEADDRCRVTLDTEFLAFAGQLDDAFEADWLWEGRVAHVHVKDWNGSLRGPDGSRRYLLPGEGDLDFEAIDARLRERGYDGALTLEVSALASDGTLQPERLRAAEAWALAA